MIYYCYIFYSSFLNFKSPSQANTEFYPTFLKAWSFNFTAHYCPQFTGSQHLVEQSQTSCRLYCPLWCSWSRLSCEHFRRLSLPVFPKPPVSCYSRKVYYSFLLLVLLHWTFSIPRLKHFYRWIFDHWNSIRKTRGHQMKAFDGVTFLRHVKLFVSLLKKIFFLCVSRQF